MKKPEETPMTSTDPARGCLRFRARFAFLVLASIALTPRGTPAQVPSLTQGEVTWMGSHYTSAEATATMRSHATGWISGCSGTWIGPTLFMTANHCGISPGDFVKMELYPQGSRVEGQDKDHTYTCTRLVARAWRASGSDLMIWQCGTDEDVAPGDRHGWIDYSILENDRKDDDVYSVWSQHVQSPPNNWGRIKLYSGGQITNTGVQGWAAPNCVNHRDHRAQPYLHRTDLYMTKGGSGSSQLSRRTHTIVVGPTSTGGNPGKQRNASSMRQILNQGDLPPGEIYRIETTDLSKSPDADPLTGIYSSPKILSAGTTEFVERLPTGEVRIELLTLEVENVHFFREGMLIDVMDGSTDVVLSGASGAGADPQGAKLDVLKVDAANDQVVVSGNLRPRWITAGTDYVDISVPTTGGGCAEDESHLYGLQETDSDGDHVIDIHEEIDHEITNRDIYTLDFNTGWRRTLWKTGDAFQKWERISFDEPWQFYALAEGTQPGSRTVLEHDALNLKPNTTYSIRVSYWADHGWSLPGLEVSFDGPQQQCKDSQVNRPQHLSSLARRDFRVSTFQLKTGPCQETTFRLSTVDQGRIYLRSAVVAEEGATWDFETWDKREPWRKETATFASVYWARHALVHGVASPDMGDFSAVLEDQHGMELPMIPLQPCTKYRLHFSATALQGSPELEFGLNTHEDREPIHRQRVTPSAPSQPTNSGWHRHDFEFETGARNDAMLWFARTSESSGTRMAVDRIRVVPESTSQARRIVVDGECVPLEVPRRIPGGVRGS